jgi:hypothetical protein
MDYTAIKHLASEIDGITVRDLIALAPQNDPFYVGTKGDLEKARWFAGLWHQFGYTTGVHLRRVHYRLVSQDPPILKPNGLPYENTEQDWDYINLASKCARYLGLVSPDAFVDRRNPDPHVYARYSHDPTPGYKLENEWGGLDVDLPTFPDLPDFAVSGYDDGNLQPVHQPVQPLNVKQSDAWLPPGFLNGIPGKRNGLVTTRNLNSAPSRTIVPRRSRTTGEPTLLPGAYRLNWQCRG